MHTWESVTRPRGLLLSSPFDFSPPLDTLTTTHVVSVLTVASGNRDRQAVWQEEENARQMLGVQDCDYGGDEIAPAPDATRAGEM